MKRIQAILNSAAVYQSLITEYPGNLCTLSDYGSVMRLTLHAENIDVYEVRKKYKPVCKDGTKFEVNYNIFINTDILEISWKIDEEERV